MALKRPKGPAGTLLVLEHSSKILKDNPWRDPHVRKVGVWLPPQYDHSGSKRFPVLYDLVGFTGSGLRHTNWKPFGDNVPERAARLMREGKMGPAIFVFPDCFTALGGNQYVNSSDRKSTRLNSSHANISYAVFCLQQKSHCPAASSPAARRARRL